MNEPKYKHDCNACIFLGHLEGADHYICKDSLIARDSSEGPDYSSFPIYAVLSMDPDHNSILKTTLRLAKNLGYIRVRSQYTVDPHLRYFENSDVQESNWKDY